MTANPPFPPGPGTPPAGPPPGPIPYASGAAPPPAFAPYPVPYPYPAPPRRESGVLKGMLTFFVGLLLGGVLLVGLTIAGCMALITMVPTPATPGKFEEKFVSGERGAADKIALIRVEGVLIGGGEAGLFGVPAEDLITRTMATLKEASEDTGVKAILLEVNSPGGGITDCDKIHNLILKIRRERPELKWVVLMDDVAASGGYYISAPADLIMAHPTTLTGSIGVIMQFYNVEELMGKIGVRSEVVKSAEKKDIGSMTRAMSPEERALLQAMLDRMYGRFVSIVHAGRKSKLTLDQVKTLADGSIFTGDQAKEKGLVDEIGYFEDAVEAAAKLAGLGKGAYRVQEYRRRVTLAELFEARTSAPPAGVALNLQSLSLPKSPRLLYLWGN